MHIYIHISAKEQMPVTCYTAGTLKICPKLSAGISASLRIYVVMGTCCDCGSLFCHCYDILA